MTILREWKNSKYNKDEQKDDGETENNNDGFERDDNDIEVILLINIEESQAMRHNKYTQIFQRMKRIRTGRMLIHINSYVFFEFGASSGI